MFPKAWVGRTLFGHHGLSYVVPQNDILLVVAQSLIGIGISPGAIAWTDNEPVLCDRLLLLDGLTFHGQYQSGLCARALQALAADVPAAPPWKLFISRRARDRPLLNEDRVAEVLRERGFRVVDPGRMSLREQIAVFKGAQIVVGALGAALTNIAFCASGTPVIALTSASFPDTFFWFLAQHPRLDYREIRGTDIAAPGDPQPWNKGFTLTEADIGCLATL